MSKGSKRRPENRRAVLNNWPFPEPVVRRWDPETDEVEIVKGEQHAPENREADYAPRYTGSKCLCGQRKDAYTDLCPYCQPPEPINTTDPGRGDGLLGQLDRLAGALVRAPRAPVGALGQLRGLLDDGAPLHSGAVT